jgi:hypothetical protein
VVSLLEFHHGDVLAETHQRIEKVNFSHSGIISCVVELVGGGAIETGMIANDGEFGASQRPKNCVAPKVPQPVGRFRINRRVALRVANSTNCGLANPLRPWRVRHDYRCFSRSYSLRRGVSAFVCRDCCILVCRLVATWHWATTQGLREREGTQVVLAVGHARPSLKKG